MKKDSVRNTFFKRHPFGLHQATTVRCGFIIYLLLGIVAIPSSISGQQQIDPISPQHDLPCMPSQSDVWSSVRINAPLSYPESERYIEDEEDDFGALTKLTPFQGYILQAAETYQVDPALIKAIIKAESSYDHMAVSERGAQGLMQLMPTTARWLGVEDSFDPELNIDGGVRYFRSLLDRYKGNVRLALAAYNAGPVYVRKYNGVPPFDATHAYIKKVLRYQRIYQQEIASQETVGSSV